MIPFICKLWFSADILVLPFKTRSVLSSFRKDVKKAYTDLLGSCPTEARLDNSNSIPVKQWSFNVAFVDFVGGGGKEGINPVALQEVKIFC